MKTKALLFMVSCLCCMGSVQAQQDGRIPAKGFALDAPDGKLPPSVGARRKARMPASVSARRNDSLKMPMQYNVSSSTTTAIRNAGSIPVTKAHASQVRRH